MSSLRFYRFHENGIFNFLWPVLFFFSGMNYFFFVTNCFSCSGLVRYLSGFAPIKCCSFYRTTLFMKPAQLVRSSILLLIITMLSLSHVLCNSVISIIVLGSVSASPDSKYKLLTSSNIVRQKVLNLL